jgi:hypothetical protein
LDHEFWNAFGERPILFCSRKSAQPLTAAQSVGAPYHASASFDVLCRETIRSNKQATKAGGRV